MLSVNLGGVIALSLIVSSLVALSTKKLDKRWTKGVRRGKYWGA